MAELEQIRAELYHLKDPVLATNYKRYLKSPYEFYGLRVPEIRKIAKKYTYLDVYETFNLFDSLWNSNNHEEMCLGLFLLANHKKKFNLEFWDFLLNEKRIIKFKTWDHVDEACGHTLGVILANNAQLNSEIKKMAESKNPWIRRISIVSQGPSIRKGKLQLTFLLAEKLCYDEDVYVQKGCGWMLRECGKKNPIQLKEFLMHHRDMKSICLSYASEKMPEVKKQIKEKLVHEKEHGKEKMFSADEEEEKLSKDLEKIKYFKKE